MKTTYASITFDVDVHHYVNVCEFRWQVPYRTLYTRDSPRSNDENPSLINIMQVQAFESDTSASRTVIQDHRPCTRSMSKLKTDVGKKGTAEQQSEGRTDFLSGIVWRMHGHEQVSGAGNVNRLVISRQQMLPE